MRLSALVVAVILFVSATLLAQHSSGGGVSSSGGSSGGGHSGGSSQGGSGSSHVSSGGGSGSARGSGSNAVRSPNDGPRAGSNGSAHDPKSLSSVKPEKRSFASALRHPFKKPKPVATAQFKRCLRGPCPVCPPGESGTGNGACVANNPCAPGQSWNGFACGVPYRFNDCSALAGQLAAERRRMQERNDPGEALFYRLLLEQYQSCLARPGAWAGRSPLLLDTLFDTP